MNCPKLAQSGAGEKAQEFLGQNRFCVGFVWAEVSDPTFLKVPTTLKFITKPSIRSFIFCGGVEGGTQQAFDALIVRD